MFQPMPIPNPNQNSRTNANPHYHISLRQLQGHSATAAALQIREPQPDRAKLWERKRAGTHRTRVWCGMGRGGNSLCDPRACNIPIRQMHSSCPSCLFSPNRRGQCGPKSTFRALFITDSDTQTGLRTADCDSQRG